MPLLAERLLGGSSMYMLSLLLQDRQWIKDNQQRGIYDMGLYAFRAEIADKEGIQQHITDTLLDMVGKERSNEVIDKCVDRIRVGVRFVHGSVVFLSLFRRRVCGHMCVRVSVNYVSDLFVSYFP